MNEIAFFNVLIQYNKNKLKIFNQSLEMVKHIFASLIIIITLIQFTFQNEKLNMLENTKLSFDDFLNELK